MTFNAIQRPLRILYPLLILLFITTACQLNRGGASGSALRTICIIDRNGMSETISNAERLVQYEKVDFLCQQPYKKVLRIYNRDKCGNIVSLITSYHPNGQPKQYLEVVNTRAYGNYKEWHENGTLKLEAFVIGGEPDISPTSSNSWLFDSHAFSWDENGSLIADISYNMGALDGESIYYHTNGSLWKRIPFQKNKICGAYEIFLEDGQLLQRIQYTNGKKEGTSIRYWNHPEHIACEEEYKDDLLLNGKYYNKSGELVSLIQNGNGLRATFSKNEVAELQQYKNGIKEGEVIVFADDKKPIRRYYEKGGVKHGEELEYFDMPSKRDLPRLLVTWHEGKVQGIVKTWYDDGAQESNREMSNNAKNGLLTAWYRDGSLMLVEEYEQDKIRRGEYFRRGERTPISTIKDGKGIATFFDSEGNFLHKTPYIKGMPDFDPL